ncbi:putative LPS assembly protein LptD [Polaribacter sp. PL03]|uniref:putative LPS assembly protein LptD n=1 Tax=Polaribacter sp. PL03 TaxID=3088353 RepID=UPI0029D2C3D4|nr:putative LPS assembly protein LptD [Polaribacter sp. PL03]MDX6747786.1 putative LPS assembly protein LptD [Polaribacter sp. PL03]
MQTNLSYILLFCIFFFTKLGFSQDIKTTKKITIPLIEKDTIPLRKTDSTFSIKKDSLLLKNRDSISLDSIKPKETIEDIITHVAKDYTIQNAKNKTVTLYNEANITYTDIDLKAGIIVVDYIKNTLFAKGIIDSTGYTQRPVFKQGSEESEQDSIIYNFKSKKALIYGLKTKQGEMFTFGEKTKRVNDSTIYVRDIKFTTSEKLDYYIGTSKAKIIPGKKIIVGGSLLYIADIPTPIYLPFAYFPITQTSVSGFLIPAFDTGSSDRGIGFQNGGYYFAINDYVDLGITGDAYSNGSWGFRASSNYNKRYRFNGAFNFSFENNINGIRGFDDYSKANNFNIRWNHNQDTKASPNSRFTASVNLGSSKFFRESQNQFNVAQTQTNTFNSSINYSKTFVGTPFNLNVTAQHQQNTNTEQITMTLPSLNLNMNRIYPFAGKDGVKKNPIQKMGFNYTLDGKYLINTTDDDFLTAKMFETARAGMQHKTGTSTNLKAFKYFTVSPSVNYEETWQFDYIQKDYDVTENVIVTDTLRGFKSYREYNAGVSLSTNIYGTFNFKKGRLKAIRHTFRPSISYSYRPDFKDKYLKQVQASNNPSDIQEYTVFDQGIYGGPSSGLSNSIGISLNNVLEAKVASKDPNSDEEDEKITLLNNLNFSSSYNIAADSLRWSPVSFSAGTRLLKDKLSVNLSGSLDPYKVIESSTGSLIRVNQFNSNFLGLRLTNASLTANYSISSADFKKDKEGGKKDNNRDPNNATDVIGADINPTDRFGQTNNGINKKKEDKNKTAKLYRADIPWSINLAYSTNYINNGIDGGSIGVHSIMFSGNVELSPKWKLGYSSGYDVKGGAFTFSRFNFTRDLDSWNFNFNWVPFGTNSSYTFFIGVKSSILSDLKWDKNKPPDRTLF